MTPHHRQPFEPVVAGIGSRLAPGARGDAVESADASGFDLEHVDDIRYGIRSEIWEGEAETLKSLVEALGKQALANRR